MRPRLSGMPLALAITLALLLKAGLLYLLWLNFFSAPQAKKMRMPTASVEQHLLSAPSSRPRP
ncbi:MAG: cytochrome oxidase putative small subunit CydP [Pseudomonadota bacterium]